MYLIAALYANNICSLVLGGTRFPGFHLLSGIRQGCPLSPLCFAVAADLLLRRLHWLLPDATIRAYADDLAVVLRTGQSAFPLLITIFEEYALIAGLQLNMPKTVLVPLRPVDLAAFGEDFKNLHPAWRNIHIEFKAKYLGFYLGPERGHTTYDKPLAKYRQRAKDWGAAAGGLALSTLAYAVYILPVILFVAQLDRLPPNWASVEQAAVRNLLPGPASWFTVDAARGLQCLGLPEGFADLSILHKAIQFRVATMEGASQGGLNVIHRARSLPQDWTQCNFLARKATWSTWFQAAYLFQLRDAIHHCASQGITKRILEDELAGHIPRPYAPEMRQSIRCRWQKTVWKIFRPGYLPTDYLPHWNLLSLWQVGKRLAGRSNTKTLTTPETKQCTQVWQMIHTSKATTHKNKHI